MSYDFSRLDFDDLKADIINYIKEDETFTDYNFDGSALNSISNLLAYITLQQNFYLNMTTQELYLDTALLYRNAVAIARSMNYTPYRNKAAYLTTDFSLPDKEVGTVEIPNHCQFLVNDVPFITKTSYNISTVDPVEIELHQLEIITETFTYDDALIELIYGAEIDNNYLELRVNDTLWSLYDSSEDILADSTVYFTNLNYSEKIEINFGNNVFGLSPTTGDTIDLIYGITNGITGNNLNEPKLDQVITDGTNNYSNSDVIFENTTLSINGSDKETINSIKINSPRFYESQNRAITENDYQVFLEQRPEISKANVWSGADNNPPLYGTVFFAARPFDGSLYLTPQQKTDISEYIKEYMPLSIRFEITDPMYIYIEIDSIVYYYKTYGTSTTELRTTIENNIQEYFDDELSVFDTRLKYSNLVQVIDEPNEVSNNITEIVYFIQFDKSPNNHYEFNLRNLILPESIDNIYIKDLDGNILDKIDDSIIGTINYSTGELSFSKTLDAVDNQIRFKTATSDADFLFSNLPILSSTTLIFESI